VQKIEFKMDRVAIEETAPQNDLLKGANGNLTKLMPPLSSVLSL